MRARRISRQAVSRLVVIGIVLASSGLGVSQGQAASPVPVFVQQMASHAPGVSSLAVQPGASVTAGNRLVAVVGVWSSAGAVGSTVTDSASDVFVKLLQFKAPDGTDMSVWTAPVTSGGGTRPSITARPSSNADVGIAVSEYAGLSTAADATAVDQQAHASGTSTTAASGATPATSGGNELAVGLYVDSGFGDTLSPGAGYTARTNIGPTGDMELMVEDQVVAQGATPNATVSTGSGTTWLMATMVFKPGVAAPPTTPGAPSGVVAGAGNGSALVSWTAPSNGGSPITAYTVTPYVAGVAQAASTVTGSPPATSVVVGGLINGTTYTFTVTAANVVGTGPPSTPSNTVTPSAAPQAPAIDPSTPPISVVANNVTSVTTAAFSPPAASVIYAAFSMDSYPTDVNANIAAVANSGSALAWHFKGRENHTGPGVGGFVEIWWAYNPVAQVGINVTGTFGQPSKNVTPPVGALQVVVFTNAAADQTTAAWNAGWDSGAGGLPTASVTTTRPNSLVLAVANNWDTSDNPTAGAGQTTTVNGRLAVTLNPIDLDAYWVQVQNAPTPVAGPVTMNDTAPSVRYHMIAWEVLAP